MSSFPPGVILILGGLVLARITPVSSSDWCAAASGTRFVAAVFSIRRDVCECRNSRL